MDYDLIIFDLDGTLSPIDQPVLYKDAEAWLDVIHPPIIICSNQGGVGLGHWMRTNNFGNPEKWPTVESFEARIKQLFDPYPYFDILRCYAYQSKTSGKWSPTPVGCEEMEEWRHDWRKPAPGMLLRAMELRQVDKLRTLMVGDSTDDLGAATAAGCHFMPDWEFFVGRPAPEKGLR